MTKNYLPVNKMRLCYIMCILYGSCTWPTISGMPRARSISCRAMTSAVLSRESSWSRSARSSLGPSLLARGPSSSSRGCPNWSLPLQMTREALSHRHHELHLLNWGVLSRENLKGTGLGSMWKVYLFMFLWGRSIPMADSGQEGDWGGGPGPPNRLIAILPSLEPLEVKMVKLWSI